MLNLDRYVKAFQCTTKQDCLAAGLVTSGVFTLGKNSLNFKATMEEMVGYSNHTHSWDDYSRIQTPFFLTQSIADLWVDRSFLDGHSNNTTLNNPAYEALKQVLRRNKRASGVFDNEVHHCMAWNKGRDIKTGQLQSRAFDKWFQDLEKASNRTQRPPMTGEIEIVAQVDTTTRTVVLLGLALVVLITFLVRCLPSVYVKRKNYRVLAQEEGSV